MAWIKSIDSKGYTRRLKTQLLASAGLLLVGAAAFWGVLGTMALFGVSFAGANLVLERTM